MTPLTTPSPAIDFAAIRSSCPKAFAALEKWGSLCNPRDLFDFFDQQGIITAITPISENPVEYFWRVNLSNIKPGPCGTRPTRAAAEAAVFTAGFAKLEQILQQ